MVDDEDCLLHRWVHVWEEDAGASRTYRREGTNLPRSRRPRQSLEFLASGGVVSRVGGPADARVSSEGRWTLAEGQVLRIRWSNQPVEATMKIDQCDEEWLVITTRAGTIEPPGTTQ